MHDEYNIVNQTMIVLIKSNYKSSPGPLVISGVVLCYNSKQPGSALK